MRRRQGGSVIEVAMFVPIVVTLLVGMVQIGKITYIYHTLQKALYTAARYVAVQQNVNFCDDGDIAIITAKNLALNGTGTEDLTNAVLPNFTADQISIAIERISGGALGTCECSVTGCDAAAGGRPPDFVVVSIPNGYAVTPRIPFLTLDAIPLRPQVRVPFGGT